MGIIRWWCVLTVLFWLQANQVSRAQDTTASKAGVAPVLLNHMRSSREQYIYRLLQEFRRFAGTDQVLDAGDIEIHDKRKAATWRASKFQSVVRHDLDGDGIVTRAEAELSLAARPGRRIDRQLKQIFASDVDGDGSITLAEAYRALKNTNQRISRRRVSRYQGNRMTQLLDLDPNGDKRLTVDELEVLGRAAFAYFDRDGDGILGQQDKTDIKMASRAARRHARPRPRERMVRNCKLPAAAAKDRILLIGSYEAGTLSSATIAGQDHETETSVFDIEKGDAPLYIVATSFTPNIWRFTGHVERVARFVAIASRRPNKAPNVGVVGLPKNRVTFLPASTCMHTFNNTTSGRARVAKAVVAAALGRPVSKIVAQYRLAGAALPSGALNELSRQTRPKLTILLGKGNDRVEIHGGGSITVKGKTIARPERRDKRVDPLPGVDPGTHDALYRYHPGGFVKINAREVLAPGPVEDYQVLPQEAGLVQLMREGKIERLPDGMYLIKKPIARYPAGLNGAHSVKFLLGKGVPTPQGNPGHSCVLSEETGMPMGDKRGRYRCR